MSKEKFSYYRGEQFVVWQQKFSTEEFAQEFNISPYSAMKILLNMESAGLINETNTPGTFKSCIPKASNANEANAEMHQLLGAATRYVRDFGSTDATLMAKALFITKKQAGQLLKTMAAVGIVEQKPMYQAMTEEDVRAQGKNWYHPFTSSVQLLDSEGLNQMVFHASGDAIYPEVEKYVIQTGSASAAQLQRQFHIGYARAARLLDNLEEAGVIGPANGPLPRQVFRKPPIDFDMGGNEADDKRNLQE